VLYWEFGNANHGGLMGMLDMYTYVKSGLVKHLIEPWSVNNSQWLIQINWANSQLDLLFAGLVPPSWLSNFELNGYFENV